MKKAILVITLSLLLLSLGAGALAKKGLPSPGITPDSIFYFIDTLGEKIGLLFAFGAEKKAEKALKYADEKLAEVIEMAEEKETDAMEKANEKYEEYLDLAIKKAKELRKKDAENILILICETTVEHQEALSEVLEDVSKKAKDGIVEASEAAKEAFEKAFEMLPEEEQEEWEEKIIELEDEEIEKVVGAFFQHAIDKEYDKAFDYLINEDGSPISEEDRQSFRKEIEKNPIVDYSIDQITDYELSEHLAEAGFTKVKMVEFTATSEDGKEIYGGFIVGCFSDEWKIILNW